MNPDWSNRVGRAADTRARIGQFRLDHTDAPLIGLVSQQPL